MPVALLLVALALICLVRAHGLAVAGWEPRAEGERRWFAWAFRDPEVRARVAGLAGSVEPGEALYLVVPAGPEPADWYRVVGEYHLPLNRVEGAGLDAGEAPPGSRPVILPPLASETPETPETPEIPEIPGAPEGPEAPARGASAAGADGRDG